MERLKPIVDWTDQLNTWYDENKSLHEALNEVRLLQDNDRAEYRSITDKLADRIDRNTETLNDVKDDIENVKNLLERLASKLNDNAVPSVIPLPVDPVSSTTKNEQQTARIPRPRLKDFENR